MLLFGASIVGGVYFVQKLIGREFRQNPKKYEGSETYDSFSDADKKEIVRKYLSGESVRTLMADYSCTNTTIYRVLQDADVELRSLKESVSLAVGKEIPEDIKKELTRIYSAPGQPPQLSIVAESLGLTQHVVRKYLEEQDLWDVKRSQGLSDTDKDLILAAVAEAEKRKTSFKMGKDIGTVLGLENKTVEPVVILRFLAEKGKNDASRYKGSLTPDQQRFILSQFPLNEDGSRTQLLGIKDIADTLHEPDNKIAYFLYYNNIVPEASGSRRKQDLSEAQKQAIINLLEQGLTNRDICSQIDASAVRIHTFIKAYRESKGLKTSRKSESGLGMRTRLRTRSPEIIKYILEARKGADPTSYKEIAEELIELMRKKEGYEDFTISSFTVRTIHLENENLES